MDESIKERLAVLRKGDIPQGYRKTKAGIMPIDWDDTVRAKDIFKNYTDKKHNGDLKILASTQDNGIVPRSQIGIDIQCSDEGIAGYKKVSKGDFVISLRSFQGGIEYSEHEGILSPAYTILKPIKEISDGYFRNYFKTNTFIQRLNSAVYGIRDGKQIGYQDFGDLQIHYPPIAEQKKIAEILAQCDKIIELKQELIAQLNQLKKALLLAMFPAKRCNQPEIRFPGFTDDWEERTISELAEKTYGGGTPATSNQAFWNGDIPWIQSSDIVDEKLFGVDPRKYITKEGLNNSATQLVPENSIAIVTRVGVGKLAFIPFTYTTSQDFLSLSKLKTDSHFTVYACYKKLQSELNAVQGTSIKGITKDELLRKTIMVPEYDEQKQIGLYFYKLDNLIAFHHRELEETKKKKRSLTQLLLTGIIRVKP